MFIWGKMTMKLLIAYFVILGGLPILGFADINVPSSSEASVLERLNIGVPQQNLYQTFRLSLLRNVVTRHKTLKPSKIPFNAPAPSLPIFKHHHARKKFKHFARGPSYQIPPTVKEQGFSPSMPPLAFASTPSASWRAFSPAPSPAIPSVQPPMSIAPTLTSPLNPSFTKKKSLPPSQVLVLPPPPPNEDCTSVTCTEPLTYSTGGAPCSCVWPIEVRLGLNVALYTFFPLVTELAKEIATGLSLNRSQVRIMGANSATQQLDKTMVLINLVPLKENFDSTSAFFIYKMFWTRQILINTSLFGAYKVVHVRYPGLPPSPPSVHSRAANIDDLPYPGDDNEAMPIKPLGVDVSRKRKDGTGGSIIAVIVLSSITAFIVLIGILWILWLKCGCSICQPKETHHVLVSSNGKPSGTSRSLNFGSRPPSVSMSFSSSVLAYTGSAKIFSLSDIQRATDRFDTSRIVGEGGFGLVYSGILHDGRKVAVKVLKRDDQQGGREFLAEVEMLSRLHHRNLVKLIGICTEDHCRCLVYELVPNGSVESHLHGVDKEIAPLDWCARMKIALGSARGLAYLHEDSSPRVIHRDFKSSNILLEDDFTPKVSDFGLAKTALDEENKHISTHVMGTFGYLAPEYAMTGHLLVKSDVYSYGVVLLELLTGRKPVDLSQPPGQENLVAWARPLLTDKEALETIVDPTFKLNIPFDTVSKVAAIASMCVQPEVSHRPFMGEVVQALKLVCNEFDEIKEPLSRTCSHEEFSTDKHSRASDDLMEPSGIHYPMPGYDSGLETKIPMSASDLMYVSTGFEEQESSESFRRISNSAPLQMGKKRQFWQRLRGLSKGSMSEHHGSLGT